MAFTAQWLIAHDAQERGGSGVTRRCARLQRQCSKAC